MVVYVDRKMVVYVDGSQLYLSVRKLLVEAFHLNEARYLRGEEEG
jgi:hypothetical protein